MQSPLALKSFGREACYLLCADDDGAAVAPVTPNGLPAFQSTWMRETGLARSSCPAQRVMQPGLRRAASILRILVHCSPWLERLAAHELCMDPRNAFGNSLPDT